METTHPIKQRIESITVWHGTEGLVEVGAYEPEAFRVGFDGVTRIEACEKPGEYCYLPYVRVWRDDICVAEFIQHKLVGVYFKPAKIADPVAVETVGWATRASPEPPAGGWPEDHTGEPSCVCTECIPF